jgi:hypothetical protein
MLRLAEVAAPLGVPIDLHMEAVRADMPTPPRFLERSPNNPPTLKANIDRFRTLLASNRKASIIWSHAGWDNTGDRTVMLCEDLLSSNPNLYMSLKIDSVSLPLNRPVTPEGVAKPGWPALVTRFADRFVIGSDNFYAAPGVSLRDLPRAADVLNLVRQLPPGAQAKIASESPAVSIPPSMPDSRWVLVGITNALVGRTGNRAIPRGCLAALQKDPHQAVIK